MLWGPINEGKPSFFSCQQLHEKNCGLHALNHIAQHECFSREYLNAIEKEQFGPKFTDELFKYGYNQSTLLRALDEHGYTCTPAPKFDKKELGSKYLALLCYKNNHWFSLVVNQ